MTQETHTNLIDRAIFLIEKATDAKKNETQRIEYDARLKEMMAVIAIYEGEKIADTFYWEAYKAYVER